MRARALVVAALLAGPTVPLAEEGWTSRSAGLTLGVRGGYGLPYGDFETGSIAVRDLVKEKVPLWVEVGYRFNRFVLGELFLELAPATVADAYCPPGSTCSASDVRFGVAVQLHTRRGNLLDPWVGVGVGVEVLNARFMDPDPLVGDTRRMWAGIELPVDAGIDLALGSRFTLGPYVSFSPAQFTSVSNHPVGGSTTRGSIASRDTHAWLQAGLKASLLL